MKCIYRDKEYDSITEACVAAWMAEAHALGYVFAYDEQVPYELSTKVTHNVLKKLKTKNKWVERTLLQSAEYTVDFWVDASQLLCDKFDGILFQLDIAGLEKYDGNSVYLIDVKGERQPAAQAAKFSLTQKFLHYSKGLYVNKLVPCAREPKAKAKSFFMRCGLPKDLPKECYRKDGQGFVQPWKDMFSGCPTIAEAMR